MKQPKRGMLVAIAALATLGIAIGWRVLDQQEVTAPGATLADQNAPPTFDELQAAAEADPDNALKWQQLGMALFEADEFARAADAYQSAVKADAQSSVLWASLGEAQVMASSVEPLPTSAIASFERALALDAGNPRARYYLAVRRDLAGDHAGAISEWLALLADTPPGAPWENDLVRTIEQVGAVNEIAVGDRIAQAASTRDLLPAQALPNAASNTPRGPTPDQTAAAAALSPTQQQSMAEGMVAGLVNRLESEPGDVDGWIMLMRSYRQLGRNGEARRARDRAIAANPNAETRIKDAAASLKID